ncbi:MAG: hypothetical protein R2857_00625 [Vampirovibrionales bacterium]
MTRFRATHATPTFTKPDVASMAVAPIHETLYKTYDWSQTEKR